MRRHLRTTALIAVGIAIGYWVAQQGTVQTEQGTPRTERPRATANFGSTPILVLGDFETQDELSRWETKGVVATQSEEHAAHGTHAVKLTYRNVVTDPRFKLEKWFYSERKAQDWSGYQYLAFSLYNPQDHQGRLILSLKDRDGNRYKEKLHVGGKKTLKWRMPLARSLLGLFLFPPCPPWSPW